jgi:N6-adenosine-specific RNA methylase IME4
MTAPAQTIQAARPAASSAEQSLARKTTSQSRLAEFTFKAELVAHLRAANSARGEAVAFILADPPWSFEFWSDKGKTVSSPDNLYPTAPLYEIKALAVPEIAADDSVLFLWATVPMLLQALEVMSAWGFRYVSNFCWAKDRAGTGYWNRNKHEQLLVGVKGEVPAPSQSSNWESLIEAPRAAHSQKPDVFHELIEAYFPALPKIERFARGKPRPGWSAWGNKALAEPEAAS